MWSPIGFAGRRLGDFLNFCCVAGCVLWLVVSYLSIKSAAAEASWHRGMRHIDPGDKPSRSQCMMTVQVSF